MSAGIRAGASNDAYLQVNGVDVLKAESNGVVTLTKPLVVSSPAATPVLRVAKSGTQSLPHAGESKITFDTVTTDTAGGWSTVNNRYTPNVAGWYLVSASVLETIASGSFTDTVVLVKKNGVSAFAGQEIGDTSGLNVVALTLSVPVFLNGTTDYLEIFVYQQNSGALSATVAVASTSTYFSAIFLRP